MSQNFDPKFRSKIAIFWKFILIMNYFFIENDLRMTFKEQMSENEQMSEKLPRVKKTKIIFSV